MSARHSTIFWSKRAALCAALAAMAALAACSKAGPDAAAPTAAAAPGWSSDGPLYIKGMVGSEKMPFLQDPRVVAALERRKLRVVAEKLGSREIATRDFAGYDFAFPSGSPAALEIAARAKAKQTYNAFYTPMAIATWRALVPALEGAGVAKTSGPGGYYVADMRQLMGLMSQGKRWRDLKGSESYSSSKSVLVSTTDVRTSNSASMYLALASYVANGGDVVSDDAQAQKAAEAVAPLFSRQGLQEASSSGPFEDYATMGMGKAPLVLVYESQFIEYQGKRAAPNADMVLMYPSPTLYSKSVLVPLTPAGDMLGEALTQDPEILRVAAEYGYRAADMGPFNAFVGAKRVAAPASLVDVVDPPSLRMLDAMLRVVESKLQ